MRPHLSALLLGITAAAVLGPQVAAQDASQPLTEQDAHAIGVKAYVYLYPLVTMDVTRRQLTNVEPGRGFGGPSNTFDNVAAYPTAADRAVVRPNFDTLYSSAWLDLTKEPLVISVPDTRGRYYLLPMMDMWTDVFASPGWRTTGTEAGHFLVTPPGWRPDLRSRIVEEFRLPKNTQRIDAPTPHVWIIGRVQTNGPQDYDAVHEIQAGFKITPLSQWGRSPEPVKASIDPGVDTKTPAKIQVDTMSAAKFFSAAAEIMKGQPTHITDQPILALMKRIGLEPGQSFDLEKADPVVRNALQSAPEDAQKLMAWKLPTLARVANGWLMNTTTMGVYGNDYLKRAIIAQQGLGANLPQDAIYPLNVGDDTGRPLEGANAYAVHFDKDEIPPVNAFWSITLYGAKGYQVPNQLNRFALSSWMPLKYNSDGSLDLYVQTESRGPDQQVNWLPAPKGPFNLTMRLYAPKEEALTGKWNPPPVTRVESFLGLGK
jgi:hypothetical protein